MNEDQARVSKFVKNEEFKEGKVITPLSLQKLCGDQTTAYPQFRDKDGCVYRLTFKDHDNDGIERVYENSFYSFAESVKKNMHIGSKYEAKLSNETGSWVWVFTQLDVPLAQPTKQTEAKQVFGTYCNNCFLEVMTFKDIFSQRCPLCEKGIMLRKFSGTAVLDVHLVKKDEVIEKTFETDLNNLNEQTNQI